MKLKRILAGITACTIVGSTMLAMPASARTTTKVEDVSLSDLMNTAKMAADLKDDITPEKQAEILDKFDTSGNGQISIGELLAVARRVARTDESDIVNEYGTADSEETTETTAETTETTETTTTEEVTSDPILTIGGKEYKDGDTFIAKADEIYEIGVSDGENELSVSLTGSKDDEDNDLVKVNGNKFTAVKDGTLTITVKTADGQEKTITLNVMTEKSLEDIDASALCIGYGYEDEYYFSDNYKKFSNEIGEDVFSNIIIAPDPEEHWKYMDEYCRYESISGGTINTIIGNKVEIKGFAIETQTAYEDYNVDDKITYISTDTNKVTIDENGVITGIAETDGSVEIIVMVNGKEYSRFNVSVGKEKYAEAEASGELYRVDNYYNSYNVGAEGKYVENASQGKALSLKDLQNQVGEENVKSVSVKNFDGTERKIKNIENLNGVIYYVDTATSTVYYAITDELGLGSFDIVFEDTNFIYVEVLDMEQYKNTQAASSEALILERYGKMVAIATAKNNSISTEIPYRLKEGETFSLSDIVKVNGIDEPEIEVTNTDGDGNETPDEVKNLDYDPLKKTFKARELTEDNSGYNNREFITLTYKATDGITRSVKFKIVVVRPVVAFNPLDFGYDADPAIFNTTGKKYADMNGGKIYIQKNMNQNDLMKYIRHYVALSLSIDKDGIYDNDKLSPLYQDEQDEAVLGKITSDNEKMFKTNNINDYNYYYWRGEIGWADGYKLTTGDTATITVSEIYGNPNLKASFTIEVVDELPKAVINGAGTDTFTYPAKNKSNQTITFTDIVDVNNLPDGCTLVPYIKNASDNVGYVDYYGNKVNPSGTVDASAMKIINNGKHYSIGGIDVASAVKVDPDTFMKVCVMVYDAKGNIITVSDPIKLSVKGEKGMNDSFSMTIDGTTKSISAGETADFGTIYIEEGKSVDFLTGGTYTGTLSNIPTIDTAKIDVKSGKITAGKLSADNSTGNTTGKEITFTYGTGSSARTAKAKIVVVRTNLKAYYKPANKNVDIANGGTFWNAEGNTLEAQFITAVDASNVPTELTVVENYTTDANGNAVFKYAKDSKITASCITKDAKIATEDMAVDKNKTEVEVSVIVPSGLRFESGNLKSSTEEIKIIKGSITNNSGNVKITGIDASNVSGSGQITFDISAKDENGNVVAKKTATVIFTETSFKLTINGKTAIASSDTKQSIGTIYIEEGKPINYTATCVKEGTKVETPVIKATSNNTSLVKIEDNGTIIAGNLTNITKNNTKVTFTYGTGSSARTITADVVVVRPIAVAPAYDGKGFINVTGDTYFTADTSTKKAIPAFVTKVDAIKNPVLNEDTLITGDMFNADDKSGETVNWECQGIKISVINKTVDPTTLLKTGTVSGITFSDKNTDTLTFTNPWTKSTDCPQNWNLTIESNDANGWISQINGKNIECMKSSAGELGDIALNLTAVIKDKNGNVVTRNNQIFNAYLEPTTITATQTSNSENKDFEYTLTLDVEGWKVASAMLVNQSDADVIGSNVGGVELHYNSTAEEKTVKVKVRFVKNNYGAAIEKEVSLPVQIAEAGTATLSEVDEINKTITYTYNNPENNTFTSAAAPDGADYEVALGENTITVTFKGATMTTEDLKAVLKNNNTQLTIDLPEFTDTAPKLNFTGAEPISNSGNKVFTYEAKVINGWVINSVTSASGCNVKYEKETLELDFGTDAITSKKDVTVNVTFTKDNVTYTKAVDITVTPDTVKDIAAKDFTLQSNTANKELKYNLAVPDGYEIEGNITADGYTVDYNSNVVTIKSNNDSEIMNDVKLTFTLKKTVSGVTAVQEVTIPVPKTTFPTITLTETTAKADDNKTFDYTVSSTVDLTGWDVNPTIEGTDTVNYDKDNNKFTVTCNPEIGTDSKNITIKYTLSKTDNGVTYTSDEQTLEVTATYSIQPINP